MKLVKSQEVAWVDALDKGPFKQRRKSLGGDKLQCGLWELPPGKKSFPFHAHEVTEEALFVISGTASVRTPDGLTKIGPGDFVSFPAGGPAHQLVNDGSEPLVYVAMSAPQGADIVHYPDSGKVAATVAGSPKPRFRAIYKEDATLDYFDGEL